MSETELLPCPFCGGEAEFVRDTERKDIFGSSDYVYVRCKKCHAQTTKIYYSAEFHKLDEEYALAEKAWNTRKPMERIVERLEEMYKYNSEQADLYRDGDSAYMRDKKEMYMDRTNCFGAAIRTIKEVGGFCD